MRISILLVLLLCANARAGVLDEYLQREKEQVLERRIENLERAESNARYEKQLDDIRRQERDYSQRMNDLYREQERRRQIYR